MFALTKPHQIFPLKVFLIIHLVTISTSSPQVNQEIYSEEDLLAIDSSPHEVIDQLAVETFSDAQGTAFLPPPSFKPTGEKYFIINSIENIKIYAVGNIKLAQSSHSPFNKDGSYSFR